MIIFIHQMVETHKKKERKYSNNTDNLNYIHRVRKKGATLFSAITLPNPNRSSKFFYRHTQQ